MKSLLTIVMLLSAQAFAGTPAVYRAHCGMQTVPKKGEAPQTFAYRSVAIASGQTLEIYKKGNIVYGVYFLAPEGQELYMLELYAEETSNGKRTRLSKSDAASHDLNALQDMIIGLYPSSKVPTLFCGTQM